MTLYLDSLFMICAHFMSPGENENLKKIQSSKLPSPSDQCFRVSPAGCCVELNNHFDIIHIKAEQRAGRKADENCLSCESLLVFVNLFLKYIVGDRL
jgi:hypothetical protein